MKKCVKCGKVYNDAGNFCASCGGQLVFVEQAAPVNNNVNPNFQNNIQPNNATPKQKKEKKLDGKKVAITVAVCFVAALIGRGVGENIIAPSYMKDDDTPQTTVNNNYNYDDDKDIDTDNDSSYVSDSTDNPAYTKIFTDRLIIKLPAWFLTDDTSSYAKVESDGSINYMDYGHSDDVIEYMTQGIYYPIEGLTEEEVAGLENEMKSLVAQYSALNCCEVSTSRLNNYLLITVEAENINNKVAINELYSVGLVKTANADYLSMKITEESVLADGFVKK